MQCYLCKKEITENNRSKEHVVPNFLGGKIKTDKLLCKACNNKTGYIENTLNESLKYLISFFAIPRERGEIQPIITKCSDGKPIVIRPGLNIEKPVYRKKDANGTLIISAPSIEAAMRDFKKFQKKNPDIQDKNIINCSEKFEFFSGKIGLCINIDIDGVRAIEKILFNYALHKKIIVDSNVMEKSIQFIKGETTKPNIIKYSGRSPYSNNNSVINAVSIIGLPKQRKLVAYIQIFDFIKYYLVLNNNYIGNLKDDKYVFFTNGNEKDIQTDLNVVEEDIIRDFDENKVKTSFISLVAKIKEIQLERSEQSILLSAIEKTNEELSKMSSYSDKIKVEIFKDNLCNIYWDTVNALQLCKDMTHDEKINYVAERVRKLFLRFCKFKSEQDN